MDVVIYFDASYEGLATEGQEPLKNGVIEIGWLSGGTLASVSALISSGSFAAARTFFQSVTSIPFSEGGPNTFGDGLVFDGRILVASGDTSGLAAYKSASGPAGKTMYAWIRDAASEEAALHQAFVRSPNRFPPAEDLLLFTDFAETFAVASDAIAPSDVGVGALSNVIPGSGVDLNGGSPADGKGLYDGLMVLTTRLFASEATVKMALATQNVSENAGSVSVGVQRSGLLSGTSIVTFSTANGTAAAGTDYTSTSGTLTFLPTETSKTIPVPIADIPLFQGDRDFTVTIAVTGTGTVLGSPSTTTVTIQDDELPERGTIKLSSTAYGGLEDAGPIDVTIERVDGTDGPVSITVNTANITAVAGSDYTAISGSVVSFANGDGTPKTVSIPITADAIFEADETFSVTLSNPTGGAALGAPSSATATILNDDAAPSEGAVAFTSTSFSGPEDGGSITISAVRTTGSAGAVSVKFTTANGSAIAGVHYLATSGTLSWADGEAGVRSATIPILDNQDDEADRDFTVALSDPTGGVAIILPDSATVTIADDDIAGAFSFNPTASSVEEGQPAQLVIERTGGSDGDVSVTVNTADGTALAGTDYTAIIGQVVNFPHSVTSGTITVTTTDDAVFKGNRSFTANLTAPTNGATLGANVTHTVTITDNEPPNPGKLRFAKDTYTVREGNVAKLRVNRVGGSDLDVSVDYVADDGSAVGGTDFTPTAGTLTFLQGETVKFIEVPTIDDVENENPERFTVTISNPTSGATLGNLTKARVNVLDNDTTPGFHFEFARYPVVPEPKPTLLPTLTEGASQTINVIRTGLLDQTLKVRVRTQSGSAIAGEDFVPLDEVLTFGPGETSQAITVATLVEPVTAPSLPVPEDNERFQVVLENVPSNPSSVRIKRPATATVVIGRNFAVDQPDLQIRARDTAWFGDDVYNTTGALQTATRLAKAGAKEKFTVRIQNDGITSDVFLLRATPSGTALGSTVRYTFQGENIRPFIQRPIGFVTPRIKPGDSVEIEVEVSLADGANLNEGYGTTITAQSLYSTTKTDAVKALVFRGF